MKLFFNAAVLTAIAAGPALAADAYVYSEPAPAAAPIEIAEPTWTGPYIGLQAGYGYLDTTNVPRADAEGFIGGPHAGYNYDTGSVVVGAEVDYDFTDLQLRGNVGQVDGVARLKAKAGIDLGFAMPYATAGGVYAHGEIGGVSRDDIGMAVGGGADFLLTEQIIVGGEYLYHRFDDFDSTGVDIDVHTVRAKASFKF